MRVCVGSDGADLRVAVKASGGNRGDADACCEQRKTGDGSNGPPSKLGGNAVDK